MDELARVMVDAVQRSHSLNEFFVGVLCRQRYCRGSKDLGCGWSPQCMRRNVSAHHRSGPDYGSFPNPHVGKNDAVRADKDVSLDDNRSLMPSAPRSPIEVGEDGRAETYGAIVSNEDVIGMTIVKINEMGEPYVLPDLDPAQAVQPWPQARSAGTNESENVENTA